MSIICHCRHCKALLFESHKQRYNKYPDLYLYLYLEHLFQYFWAMAGPQKSWGPEPPLDGPSCLNPLVCVYLHALWLQSCRRRKEIISRVIWSGTFAHRESRMCWDLKSRTSSPPATLLLLPRSVHLHSSSTSRSIGWVTPPPPPEVFWHFSLTIENF